MRTPTTSPTPSSAPSFAAASLVAIGFSLVFAASPAHAADPKPKDAASAPKSKSADKILTPAQLRDCMAQQAKVKQGDDELVKEKDALMAEKADIAKQGETLDALLPTVDRTKAEEVNAYNEQAQARAKRMDAYGAKVDAYNEKVVSLGADHDAYAKTCNNRRFLEDDETAIKKGK